MTARRELQEETGLNGVDAKLGPTFFTYSTEIPYAHVPVFFTQVEGKAEVMPDERFSTLGYFRVDSLPQPMFEPSRLALHALLGASVHTLLGPDSGASFLKIDMVSIDPGENRNRAFTAFFLCDQERISLIVTWGRREYRGRRVRRESFPSLEQGARRLEDLVRRRARHRYYVTGISGDLPIDQVLNIFPEMGSLRVVSDGLIRRLVRDEAFRSALGQDVSLFSADPAGALAREDHDQGTLF